jgi:hypothetical protein
MFLKDKVKIMYRDYVVIKRGAEKVPTVMYSQNGIL